MKRISHLFALIAFFLAAHNLPAQKQHATMNIATFNLRFDTPGDGENAWPNRREFVKRLIAYHEFDIMGTQELLHGQISDLLQMEGWAYTGSGRDDGLQGGEHSAIFYRKDRFKLLLNGDFWLSETPEKPSLGWDATCCNRICSWAKFKDKSSNRIFFVFNAHFDHQGQEARKQSGRLMVQKIKELAAGFPVVFCGDLNSTPDTDQVKHVGEFLNDGFTTTQMPPYGPIGTFSAFRIDAPLHERIDYIFVSKHFTVLTYGALTDFLDHRFPSDHLPVVVKVRF
ncbi:MAG: endonuclease/exonuclease/phosphatase family protein [Breznakibacter sp.]